MHKSPWMELFISNYEVINHKGNRPPDKYVIKIGRLPTLELDSSVG